MDHGPHQSACQQLHQWAQSQPRHRFPYDNDAVPSDGIYLLFERGEDGHAGERIVRVGTHNGDHRLPLRLHQHFLGANKDRSIFRKNIGRALLNRARDPYLTVWNLDLTSKAAKDQYGDLVEPRRQAEIERSVTDHICRNLSFVTIPVAARGDRLRLESRLISTVSLCDGCRPTSTWLGAHAPDRRVQQSGLWQVQELYKTPMDATDLNRIRSAR